MMRHRKFLPDVSHEMLMELLDGLIRYEEHEIQRLRPHVEGNKALSSGAQLGAFVNECKHIDEDPFDVGCAIFEETAGHLLGEHVHRQPLLRKFFEDHMPRAEATTKQAVENALFKGTLKGGLWVVELVFLPEVAIPLFILEKVVHAAQEYVTVVRPAQHAQDAARMIRSRAGRRGFYVRLRRTLEEGGELTTEQVRRIVDRRQGRRQRHGR